jgi:hypothetical protein
VLSAVVLTLVAFAAGMTGAWSPCGFSMVETLGAAPGGARVVRAGCATFALGALAGGAITFSALGAFGALLDARGHGLALAAAVAVAAVAAAGELLGLRVVPQIRRQVPEPWRRRLPLPFAAGLYGILLGLGFTTFVLTLAVWALAGIAIALGSPALGLGIGLAFGLGRALPVVSMAPRFATAGERLATRMAEQPRLLRGLRLADGALLAAAALALATTGTASARTVARGATDPSTAAGALAWRAGGGIAVLQRAGAARVTLPARNVALGGPYVATRAGGRIVVRSRKTLQTVATLRVPHATQLAISAHWLVWRASGRGGERLSALALARRLPFARRARTIARTSSAVQLGRPALDGDRLVYAVASPHASSIVAVDLAHATVRPHAIRHATLTQLSQPALRGNRLLYVEASDCDQRLRLSRLHAPDGSHAARTLLRIGSAARRDPGHERGYETQGSEPSRCPAPTLPRTDVVLWTTALDRGVAFVTLLRPYGHAAPIPSARIVRLVA